MCKGIVPKTKKKFDEFQVGSSSGPQQFSQAELNDLIQDLGLPKQSTELLGSRLQEKNLLTPGTSLLGIEIEKNILSLIFLFVVIQCI